MSILISILTAVFLAGGLAFLVKRNYDRNGVPEPLKGYTDETGRKKKEEEKEEKTEEPGIRDEVLETLRRAEESAATGEEKEKIRAQILETERIFGKKKEKGQESL